MITIDNVKSNIEKFLTDTADARAESERCRDYYDGNQWTAAQIKKLKSRQQAPIVVNRIKPKVEGLIGLYNLRESDPKAFPRTTKHEQSATAITDALRYVADNNDFDTIRLSVAECFFIEGYAGAIVEVKQKKNGEIEVIITEIPWDRVYFDPHSRKKDFDDARYKGIILWMYKGEVEEKFPGVNVDQLINQTNQDETFEDKPQWTDKKQDRLRIAMHFEIHKGEWYMTASCGDTFLIEPQVSPFLDDDGEPSCPIELVSAHVARDNARYGETDSYLDQQDEINHRRSKFLHFLNSRQTFGRKGANEDVKELKRAAKSPDGHLEFNGEEFGKDFGLLPQTGAEIGQFNLYMDAKAELDAVSLNAQLSGDRQDGSLSGVAIGKLQQAGSLELNRQYQLLSNWEKRIYRQAWARVKQFWIAETWIRVTDDYDNLRWVGFNIPITMQELLEEKINDESQPAHVRKQAAMLYTQMMQAQDPRLQEVMQTQNPIPELDVDIILDQSFNVVNVQEEQFQMLAQFAQGSDVDIIDLIEVSQLRGKDALIDKIEKRRAAAAESAGGVQQLEAQSISAKTENVQADTVKKFTEAQQKQIENELLINQPDRITSVAV